MVFQCTFISFEENATRAPLCSQVGNGLSLQVFPHLDGNMNCLGIFGVEPTTSRAVPILSHHKVAILGNVCIILFRVKMNRRVNSLIPSHWLHSLVPTGGPFFHFLEADHRKHGSMSSSVYLLLDHLDTHWGVGKLFRPRISFAAHRHPC